MELTTTKKGLKIEHSLLIFFLIIILMGITSVISMLLGIDKEIGLFVNYILNFGISYFIATKVYEKYVCAYTLDLSKRYLKIIPLLIPLPILLQFGLASHISDLIPMPEFVKQLFTDLSGYRSISSFVVIVVLAPILEELIFRGIILKGLLKRYGPILAIVSSSLLFGMVHLNPWQFIGAFMIGLVNGWIFWKTENILLPIIVHFANNLFFTLFGMYAGASYLIDKPIREVFGNPTQQVLYSSMSFILFLAVLFYLNKLFKSSNSPLIK